LARASRSEAATVTAMKICDLTQFYSPLSGGVKRYVHEKINYIQNASQNDEHILIIPGAKTEVIENDRSRIYSIHSPLLSRTSRYRALLNLRAIEDVFERERPDIIESGDPYQVSWKAIASGSALRIPVVGFYHSHFPEAYLRSTEKYLGQTATEIVMDAARRYICKLYNQFEVTFVPSLRLAKLLQEWGVENVRGVNLGVNTEVFRSDPDDVASTRHSLGIMPEQKLLLYIGRLAPEKNTQTLFRSYEILAQRNPGHFHLVVIGDGAQRDQLRQLRSQIGGVTWIPYCTQSGELARYYRAADLFVHPGTQETFGFVALESQACGTPVVGIRGSYMDRIIFHEQGSWAEENSPKALAAAIEQFSESKLQRIGQMASRVAEERYGWKLVLEQLFGVYREVIADFERGDS
jgi:alpha-1,6-mannosyltransferase